MNSGWTHARVLSSEDDLFQLSKMLRASGNHLAEVYFPLAESEGEGEFGFDFKFTRCRLRSWDFIAKWCQLQRRRLDAPQTVDARLQVKCLDDVVKTTRLAESAEKYGLPCNWIFLASAGELSSATRFSFGLRLNDFGEPAFQLSIDTPIDAPKPFYPWLREFWERASSSFSLLKGGRVVLTGDDGDRPLLEVDDPGYQHRPRRSYNPTGIAIMRDTISNASAVLRELIAFVESMTPELTLNWEMTTVTLDEQAFQHHVTVHGSD